MNLSEELIIILEKAMAEDTYFNPHIIDGVLTGIETGDPRADELISDKLSKWANNMWSR
jgi:hypothetical protein